MPSVDYKGTFSQKKRDAVCTFVRKVHKEVSLPGHPHAMAGPEGQIVVFCSLGSSGSATERSVRRIMSKASQEILDSHGIWVVGIPHKERKQKQAAV